MRHSSVSVLTEEMDSAAVLICGFGSVKGSFISGGELRSGTGS